MATTVRMTAAAATTTTTRGDRSRVGRRRRVSTFAATMRGVGCEGEARVMNTSTLGRQRVKLTTRTTTMTRAMENDDDESSSSSPSGNEMSQQRFDARKFDTKIEDLASLGLTRALEEVDARLERAMRGEAASTSTNDSDSSDGMAIRMVGEAAEREAVDLMACLRQRGELTAFGAAHNVPKRDYALAELRLNGIEAEKLLAPTESTIKGIRDNFTRVFGVLYVAGLYFLHPTFAQGAGVAAFAAFCATYDQVAFGGGVSALAFDTVAQSTSKEYVTRLRRHEAAHFLTAYLIGILPKGYTLSSLDAFKTYGALNIQAGCAFCDGEFQREVQKGKITSTSLGRFACVAMAGICMEYILFGFAEGGLSDVQQLDGLLRALAFSQKKSDSEVRWAVLNTTALLRRHVGVTEKLADAMARGASVGECINLIEMEVQKAELV